MCNNQNKMSFFNKIISYFNNSYEKLTDKILLNDEQNKWLDDIFTIDELQSINFPRDIPGKVPTKRLEIMRLVDKRRRLVYENENMLWNFWINTTPTCNLFMIGIIDNEMYFNIGCTSYRTANNETIQVKPSLKYYDDFKKKNKLIEEEKIGIECKGCNKFFHKNFIEYHKRNQYCHTIEEKELREKQRLIRIHKRVLMQLIQVVKLNNKKKEDKQRLIRIHKRVLMQLIKIVKMNNKEEEEKQRINRIYKRVLMELIKVNKERIIRIHKIVLMELKKETIQTKQNRKEYYKINKQHIKEYYDKNKQKILKRKNEKITCDNCKTTISKNHLANHKKTKKCTNGNKNDK